MELSTIGNNISDSTWYYLNNTELVPGWSEPYNGDTRANELLTPHLKSCNRAAAILEQNIARIAYSRWKTTSRNIYFGKDTISDTIHGYLTHGQFPRHIIRRVTYVPETGIQVHWENYFEFFLLQISQSRRNLLNMSKIDEVKDHVSKADLNTLWFVPGVGLFLSLILFIIWDKYSIFQNQFSLYANKISRYLARLAVRHSKITLLEHENEMNRMF